MSWFNAQNPEPEQQAKPRLASPDDIETTFGEEHENLFWIGLLITGNATTSIESIKHASGLSFGANCSTLSSIICRRLSGGSEDHLRGPLRKHAHLDAVQHDVPTEPPTPAALDLSSRSEL